MRTVQGSVADLAHLRPHAPRHGHQCVSVGRIGGEIPDLVGIVGRSGDRIIIQTQSGIRALDLHSGKLLWHYCEDDFYSFPLAGDRHILVACRKPAQVQ